jgi:hypothetical protein
MIEDFFLFAKAMKFVDALEYDVPVDFFDFVG